MVQKIAIVPKAYAGAYLTDKEVKYLAQNGCEEAKKHIELRKTYMEEMEEPDDFGCYLDFIDIARNHPVLIEMLEKSPNPDIKIIEIPDGVNFIICGEGGDASGGEWVAEKHRKWFYEGAD